MAAQQGGGKRSWWDGGSQGPIGARWHVDGFPKIYVIDAQGVIRYVAHGYEPQMQTVIETLVRQAEAGRRS